MKVKATIGALLVGLLSGATLMALPGVVTVIGQDDPAVDRQNVQDAIDAAAPGDTVRLSGTFRLDGERIVVRGDLTLEGEAVDNDGDGQGQEDWGDGLDNDGDGLVDEDDWETRLIGVDAGDGSPVLNDGTNGLFNRAFVVDGVNGELRDLTIRQLWFSTLHRAIEIIPEWFSPTGRCEDRVAVAGFAKRVTVEGNRFDNSDLGITLLGDIRNARIAGNVFIDVSTFGAVLEGGQVTCPLADGSGVGLDLTTPAHNRLVGNTTVAADLGTAVSEHSLVADNVLEGGTIFSLFDRFARITGNVIRDSFAGIVLSDAEQSQVDLNQVLGGFEGILALGPAEQTLIRWNEISDTFIGLDLFDASGYTAINNLITGSLLIDLEIGFTSFGNTVINNTGVPITAFDFGFDNRLVGDIIVF